jgi:hypothetical protein
MDSDRRSSPEQWRLEDILKYLDVDDEHGAKEIFHSILTSTGILTWNGKGEIVYRGHNIRGTNIVDLLKHCVTPCHPDIPKPNGLSIFTKGLAELEIDKSLFVNGRVLTVLAHQWSRQDTQSEDVADTTCNSCHKNIYIFHLSTCTVCAWTDFYPNCRRCHCIICDFRVSEGDFTHVLTSCPHCRRYEIMDVRTDERQSFDHKIGEQSDI